MDVSGVEVLSKKRGMYVLAETAAGGDDRSTAFSIWENGSGIGGILPFFGNGERYRREPIEEDDG